VANIPLGVGAYSRPYGKLPEIRMENRFFEQNPVGAEKVSLLSRPGTSLFLEVGDGPIRTLFAQPGVFNGDLFIVSGTKLYRYDGEVVTPIDGDVLGVGYPVMTAVAIPDWDAVFITDGVTLQYYEGESRSSGALTLTGAIVADDVVRIGDTYYAFTAGDVDDGDPDGSAGDPWLVRVGASDAASLANLHDAINLGAVPGVNYSTDTDAHPDVRAFGLSDDSFQVRALEGGDAADTIVTTTTSSGLSWGAGTLEGGGGHELRPCSVPDGAAIIDLATLASFVIAVEGESRRFFWIHPGEVDIDPLDFSSMESEPDYIVNVAAVGDQFWLFGQSSTEAWYASGDGVQPFLRTQGRAFSQGILPASIAKVGEAIVVIGQDMVAYRIAGAPERISHHGIEEKIRHWQERLAAE
jgi:hypothetical protein